MKLGAMPCRATQHGQVKVQSSDKMGPVEKGTAKHSAILAERTVERHEKAKRYDSRR